MLSSQPARAERPAARAAALALALPLLAALLAPSAAAQAPKVGDWYEDTTDVGFKVRTPRGWDYIPPSPDDGNGIGKFDAGGRGYVNLSGSKVLVLNCWLLKFDRRPSREGERQKERRQFGVKDMKTWVENSFSGVVFRQESSKEGSYDGVDAQEAVWLGKDSEGHEIGLYTMVYRVAPEVEVAFVGNGPGEKKWSKYEQVWRKMARTFKRVELERVELSSLGTASLREKKRVRLQNEVASQPGWELYETPSYFIVSNVDDQGFLRELMDRLEAIRAVYEEDYPAVRAQQIRELAAIEAAKRREAEKAAKEAAKKEGGGDDEDEDEEPGEGRTVTRKDDSQERSRTSVVRVCSSRDQYYSYGGPGGSAGYWNSRDEELVIFDDKELGGRRNTWATLNHEAFHQYIFYFYGSLSPHSWYNEGSGDYYSGFQLKNNRFVLKPFDWRVGPIKDAIRNRSFVPLKELVRFTQAEYYGNNKYEAGPGQNYAEGWSFIYFLRTGEKQSKRWNPRWNGILDIYLETLAATNDLDAAVDKAFDGVDWDELEQAWMEYTK